MLNLLHAMIDDDEELGFKPITDDTKKEDKTKTEKDSKDDKHQTLTEHSFSSFKQSFMKGPHMIEEVRERSCDGTTGVTREVTRRRLGNKWVELEEETDKDGKKKTKETWHNVAENQTDEFKKLWEEHRGEFGFDHILKGGDEKKAIEHKEEKK